MADSGMCFVPGRGSTARRSTSRATRHSCGGARAPADLQLQLQGDEWYLLPAFPRDAHAGGAALAIVFVVVHRGQG